MILNDRYNDTVTGQQRADRRGGWVQSIGIMLAGIGGAVMLIIADDACFIPPTILASFSLHMIILLVLVIFASYSLFSKISIFLPSPTPGPIPPAYIKTINYHHTIDDPDYKWKYLINRIYDFDNSLRLVQCRAYFCGYFIQEMSFVWGQRLGEEYPWYYCKLCEQRLKIGDTVMPIGEDRYPVHLYCFCREMNVAYLWLKYYPINVLSVAREKKMSRDTFKDYLLNTQPESISVEERKHRESLASSFHPPEPIPPQLPLPE